MPSVYTGVCDPVTRGTPQGAVLGLHPLAIAKIIRMKAPYIWITYLLETQRSAGIYVAEKTRMQKAGKDLANGVQCQDMLAGKIAKHFIKPVRDA